MPAERSCRRSAASADPVAAATGSLFQKAVARACNAKLCARFDLLLCSRCSKYRLQHQGEKRSISFLDFY